MITPSGDPYTLAILSIPMYLFYEASILIGMLLTRRSDDRQMRSAVQGGRTIALRARPRLIRSAAAVGSPGVHLRSTCRKGPLPTVLDVPQRDVTPHPCMEESP